FYATACGHSPFGSRYYDPRLGRWKSRDPLGEAGGSNLYAYCGNDPVNEFDPVGLRVPRTHEEALMTLEMYLKLCEAHIEARSDSIRTYASDKVASRRA